MITEDTEPISLTVGADLHQSVRKPTIVELFRFSAATWNAHRIHYDQDYARQVEGYPDLLIHGPLQGTFLTQLARRSLGDRGRLTSITFRHVASAYLGDTLTCTGRVDDVDHASNSIKLSLQCVKQGGLTTTTALAEATLLK